MPQPVTRDLYLGGLGLSGNGYPNAARTVALLQKGGVNVTDCGRWLPADFHLWKLTRMARWRALGWLCRLALGNLVSLLRVLRAQRRRRGAVYVPYPAVFFLLWVSLLPRRWRPPCIADVYVSLWDSTVRDRGVSGGATAHLLRALERRALSVAALVLTDTEANRTDLVAQFDLAPERVISLPLAIDQDPFTAQRAAFVARPRLQVLFIGTLIPLHGIDTVLHAVRLLREDARFEFTLIGDGQQADRVAAFVHQGVWPNFRWIRQWQSPTQLAEHVGYADICLGVFGGEAKAARVLPFKLYMYLAAGRAVVTQNSYSLPAGTPAVPLRTIASRDASALVAALLELADDAGARRDLGVAAAQFYDRWLANERVVERWLGEILPRLSG